MSSGGASFSVPLDNESLEKLGQLKAAAKEATKYFNDLDRQIVATAKRGEKVSEDLQKQYQEAQKRVLSLNRQVAGAKWSARNGGGNSATGSLRKPDPLVSVDKWGDARQLAQSLNDARTGDYSGIARDAISELRQGKRGLLGGVLGRLGITNNVGPLATGAAAAFAVAAVETAGGAISDARREVNAGTYEAGAGLAQLEKFTGRRATAKTANELISNYTSARIDGRARDIVSAFSGIANTLSFGLIPKMISNAELRDEAAKKINEQIAKSVPFFEEARARALRGDVDGSQAALATANRTAPAGAGIWYDSGAYYTANEQARVANRQFARAMNPRAGSRTGD